MEEYSDISFQAVYGENRSDIVALTQRSQHYVSADFVEFMFQLSGVMFGISLIIPTVMFILRKRIIIIFGLLIGIVFCLSLVLLISSVYSKFFLLTPWGYPESIWDFFTWTSLKYASIVGILLFGVLSLIAFFLRLRSSKQEGQKENRTGIVNKLFTTRYNVNLGIISRFLFALFVLLSFSPFIIAMANQRNFSMEINSPYLNGLVTACGVFVAFISASVISKAKDLESLDFTLTRTTLLLFVGSVVYLSYTLIVENRATILNLTMFSITIIVGSFTAWGIMHTLFRKCH